MMSAGADRTVRPLRPEDAGAVASIRKRAWLALYTAPRDGVSRDDVAAIDFDSPKVVRELSRFLAALDDATAGWLASDRHGPAGFCIAARGPEDGRILASYVVPMRWRQGWGRLLVETALAWLEADGRPVRVAVVRAHGEAVAFYQALGFATTGRRFHSLGAVLPDGRMLEEAELVRQPLSGAARDR